jgi:hypothetical protein
LNYFVPFVASVLSFSAQAIYIIDIHKGKVKPSVLSWFGWGLITGMGWLVNKGEWNWSQFPLLGSAVGSMIIGLYSILIGTFQIAKHDWYFLFASIICSCIYLFTRSAILTIFFGILSDILLSIPSFVKAYRFPKKEQSISWILGLISWSLTLFSNLSSSFLELVFPVYFFVFNLLMVVLTFRRVDLK